jgi:transcriptional regulator with XRE-family HTH domain
MPVDAAAKAFGEAVRERYRAQMSQAEFARQVGVSATLVGYWVRGVRRPGSSYVERAAEVLSCLPADLWAGWDDGDRPEVAPRRQGPNDAERIRELEIRLQQQSDELARHRDALERAGWLERVEGAVSETEAVAEEILADRQQRRKR